MNTSQLQCMLACDPVLRDGVLGVFAADQLPTRVPSTPCGCIVNTDNSSQPGTHWLALFIQTDTVECFDSYGQPPGSYNPLLTRWIQQQHVRNVRVNSTRLQSDFSNVCGLYCVYFLHERLLGQNMDQIVEPFSRFEPEENDRFIFDLMSRVYSHCVQKEGTYTQGCQPLCRKPSF